MNERPKPDTQASASNEVTSSSGLHIETESELETYLTQLYEEIIGDAGGQEVHDYFFTTVIPHLREIYKGDLSRIAARAQRIIENGSNVRVSKIGEYFHRAIRPEELSFARLPQEKLDQISSEVRQAVANALSELRKRYGPDVKLPDAVIIYGTFAKGGFTFESDVDVAYVTASSDKSEYYDEEYVDAEGELTRLLAQKTGREIDLFLDVLDINEPESIHRHTDDGLLSGPLVIISPDAALREKLETLLSHTS